MSTVFDFLFDLYFTERCLDYWINWLRTKARYDRYEEEFRIVKDETRWTLLYFETQRLIWVDRGTADSEERLRHKAYVLKQAVMWEKFGTEGRKAFEKLMNVLHVQ